LICPSGVASHSATPEMARGGFSHPMGMVNHPLGKMGVLSNGVAAFSKQFFFFYFFFLNILIRYIDMCQDFRGADVDFGQILNGS
jgi:hypothetical protein